MSTLHDTTYAVQQLIDTGSFSRNFDPVLSYDTELILEDAGTLNVAIVPGGMIQVADSRVSLRYDVAVDVAIRYRFGTLEHDSGGAVEAAEVGALVDLLEEIAEHLAKPANRALTKKTAATWLQNEIRMPWVPEHLRQNRQYTGILRATYVVAKDL